MSVVPTDVDYLDTKTVKKIIGEVRKIIPVGFSHHEEAQHNWHMPVRQASAQDIPIVDAEYESARKQIGTLGSGNHFWEIQQGDDDRIWLMVHSGSRNLGYKVAKHYSKVANDLNERWYTDAGEIKGKWYPSRLVKNELAILPIGTSEARRYLAEMQYCMAFAEANRRLMMSRAASVFEEVTGGVVHIDEMVDIHHNYVSIEHHFGQDVWVHRKGATLAREGTIGIIPGSQGTHSYIVDGKGNPDSFNSCSHGAGRQMGRKQAKRELNLADEQARMEGIVHSVRDHGNLDEAPGAYKDIGEVMAAQEDLVKILVELTPLGVLKG